MGADEVPGTPAPYAGAAATIGSPMTKLTLIRHGLTEWNVSGKFQGQTDLPLSTDGREQSRQLAQYLEPLDVAEVWTSPLRRARETAEIAFPDHDIRIDPRLMELHFGAFEGSTQIENEAHERWAWWYDDPFERNAPGGESYRELRERVVAWYEELPAAGHVIAFTHSGTIQMLLSHVIGVERPRWRKRFFLRHTSLTRVVVQAGHAVVERVNDTRHLAGEFDPFFE